MVEFDTEITKVNGIYTVSALGQTASSQFQDIALDALNHKLNELIQRGELRPS
jgi:hypothetical protein